MRQLVTILSLLVWGMLALGVPAVGQMFQPARNSTPASPPTLHHFSGVRSTSAAPVFGVRDVPVRVRPAQQPTRPEQPQQAPARGDSRPRPIPAGNPDHGHRHHHHGDSIVWWGWGPSYPWIWPPLYTSAFGPHYSGVANLPSGPLFNDPRLDAAAVAVPAPALRDVLPAPEPTPRGQPKATNPEQKAKAGKFLAFGDTNFAGQKYLAALGRYKTAAQVAPDLGEPYFRQGHAHVALGQYDSAIKAFRRGLRIEGDWTASPFRLDHLYNGDVVAKTGHLENLAKAVEANSFSTDLLTLLGLELFFDGQRERAFPFFERAVQLGGNEERLLDAFLPKPAPAGEPQPPLKPARAEKVVF